MKNYYYILGVHKNTSIQEIKSAYRKLAIRLHPDKNGGDKFFEDRFKDIKEAYETLSDDLKKKHYDIKLAGNSSGPNDEAFKVYKELLKRRYKDELRKREEDISKKYRKLEQELQDEAESKKAADASIHKKEKYRLLNEIEGYKRTLEQKEQRLKSIRQKISATEAEMIRVKKDAALSISKIGKSRSDDSDKTSPASFLEHPEILKELVKIRELIPRKELIIFLKMVLKYAETRSLTPKYGRDHPHLVRLIMKESIQMKPFKMFYTKHKNDPKMISDFKGRLLQYFNLFPI
jgi:curved DNA-binding protein CbpA